MNKETMVRAIVGAILAIFNLIKLITGIEICVGDDVLYALVDFAYVCWIGWKNNDFTQISSKATKIMRRIKKLAKTGDLSLLDAIESAVDKWEADYDNRK